MLDKNTQGEVWVFAEQEDGRLSEVGLELLSKGRELAGRLGVKLACVLLGGRVRSLTNTLIAHGADKVYLSEDPLLEHYQANPYTKVITRVVREQRPQIVLFGASGVGRDLAPRVASTMRCGLTADCTDLEIGDHEETTKGVVHKNLLLQIRPAFGGNIIATIVNPDRWPQMATVREGVMRMPDADSSRKGEVVTVPAQVTTGDLALKLVDRFRAEKRVNLKAARVIVSGGAGVGSKENFRLIYDLANVLGGVVGGSRAAVDSGYVHKDHQVGQTGTTVRPALYIACGISGAVQHRAGMGEAKKIVAINKDPQAPIFGIAHYAIIGDLNSVIPKMIRAIRNRG